MSAILQNINADVDIPAELKELAQWVLWKYTTVSGRVTKVPFDAKNGRKASTTNPATWSSLDQALRSLRKYPKYDGIGFVFSQDDPYCGIDLDHCIGQDLLPQAREIVESLQTYTEITPSGTGLHLILKGKLPYGHSRKDNIEMYGSGRYFTVTGHVFEGHSIINERQAELEALFARVFAKPKQPTATLPAHLGIGGIVELAINARNGAKFSQLWAGDIGCYPSRSEADQALCNLLAFWTGKDPLQMDTLFRQSGLYREKWERQDYREWTIGKAIAQCQEVYEPGSARIKSDTAATEPPEAWPEPMPVNPVLQPVEPLPTAIIPESFRDWLADTAGRMTCPLDYVAVAAMIEAGSVIGAGCGIRPKVYDDWLVIPNLWGGVIGPPSQLKTPALAAAMKPVAQLEVKAKTVYESVCKDFEAGSEIYKAQKDALKSEMAAAAKGKAKRSMDAIKAEYLMTEEPVAPTRRRYKTNDATIEKLHVLLSENPRGMLVYRDELVGLLVNWDREDHQPDRTFYLEAWNGNGSMNYTADRIGRGTTDTPNLCISILGGMQPGKLLGYLLQAADNLKNDGLVQRFQLLVYPDETEWELVDRRPNIKARDRAYGIFEKLADMDFLKFGAELPDGEKIPVYHFSPEAQHIFYDWLRDLRAKIKAEANPLLVEHLTKYQSLMPSLALIFRLINIADGQPGGPVTVLEAEQAAAWCDYLESHARRIYAMLDNTDRATEELSQRIKNRELHDGFTVRDVYRNCWSSLDTKERAQQAVDELVSAGWLCPDAEEIAGRQPKTVYRINPRFFS